MRFRPRNGPHLYRLRSFLDAGVTLAAGSDAPFGSPESVGRDGSGGNRATPQAVTPCKTTEALTPEQALDLFLAEPLDLGRRRRVEAGAPADLCLLSLPWKTGARDPVGAIGPVHFSRRTAHLRSHR